MYIKNLGEISDYAISRLYVDRARFSLTGEEHIFDPTVDVLSQLSEETNKPKSAIDFEQKSFHL